MEVLTFKNTKLKLQILRETSKHYITNNFFSLGIGNTKKATVRWDKETSYCLDSSESIKFKGKYEQSVPDAHTY